MSTSGHPPWRGPWDKRGASLDLGDSGLITNADGSVNLSFGPHGSAPAGKEANWVETRPGKGWFEIFRLYGPLEPSCDKTWRLDEIEVAK